MIDAELRAAIAESQTHGLEAVIGHPASYDYPRLLSEAYRERLEEVLEGLADGGKSKEILPFVDALSSALKNPAMLMMFATQEPAPLETLRGIFPLDGTHMLPLDTPLAENALLTGINRDPTVFSQLRKEIASADQIDILCSFIKWSGLRLIINELREFVSDPSHRLRVLTTNYMGATDPKAIEELAALPRTELKVSYDTQRTRFHAKAYCFSRKTGFGSAYVGSANVSRAALNEGLEWIVKISEVDSPGIWQKAKGTFESYWEDDVFEAYMPGEGDRFREAIARERRGATDPNFNLFDLRPFGFQEEILDKLAVERTQNHRHKNLVVAATGTGKTMVAGFDYRNFSNTMLAADGRKPRLLFVAHTGEILRQSQHAFRGILRDGAFGEMLVGDQEPTRYEHVFCSIQSYNARRLEQRFPPDYFDYVVVDEFHHAAAPTYRTLLSHVTPQELLGLTATPERTDVQDILHYFGGRSSAEIRLPDAIARELLCPFQYFGVADILDYSQLTWRGGYVASELEAMMVGHQGRVALILEQLRQRVTDVMSMRALGFCATVQHAEYMADCFNQAGIPAAAVSGEHDLTDRQGSIQQLRAGELKIIFSVSVFSEGVDIPEVDTVLLLRPTSSLIVFLQQIGRGLRRSEGKDCLTILDFVGQAHKKFKFGDQFRALSRDFGRNVAAEIERGFPHLPPGCAVILDPVARDYIVANIKGAVTEAQRLILLAEEQAAETGSQPTYAEFLEHNGIAPELLYKYTSFAELQAKLGWRAPVDDPDADRLLPGLRRVSHLADPKMLESLDSLDLDQPWTDQMRRHVRMLHFGLWTSKATEKTEEESWAHLQSNPAFAAELRELVAHNVSRRAYLPIEQNLPFECPLMVHAAYSRDEILAACDDLRLDRIHTMKEGVRQLPEKKAVLMLVTLDKSEDEYSPTTMYRDYAISDRLFHWQSQNSTSPHTEIGRRFIEHRELGYSLLLFVREKKEIDSKTCPYLFLGLVDYVSHEGSKPMSIVWSLREPLPAAIVRASARLKIA